MLYLTVNNRGFSVPADWSEMTLGQFLAYLKAETPADMLTALSGLSLADLGLNTAPDLSAVLGQLSYLRRLPDYEAMPVPTRLTVGGKSIEPPIRIDRNRLSLQQCWDLTELFRSAETQPERADTIVLAHSLLSIVLYAQVEDKPSGFSAQPWRGESYQAIIDSLPVTDALPLAHSLRQTYLSSLVPSDTPPPKGWHMTEVPAPTASRWEKLRYWLFNHGIYLPQPA